MDVEYGRLLAAARDEFVTHGLKRTSVGNIAKRARVSRPTVYRRLGDKDQIVRAVLLAEIIDYLAGIRADILDKSTPAERAIEAFVRGVRAFHENPLTNAIMEFEPETMSSIFDPENSEWIQTLRAAIATTLTGPGYPMEAAMRASELILRLTVSLLLAPSRIVPVDTDERARWFAVEYFTPLIDAAGAAPP